jgi:hypothetical protein
MTKILETTTIIQVNRFLATNTTALNLQILLIPLKKITNYLYPAADTNSTSSFVCSTMV